MPASMIEFEKLRHSHRRSPANPARRGARDWAAHHPGEAWHDAPRLVFRRVRAASSTSLEPQTVALDAHRPTWCRTCGAVRKP